MYKKLETVGSRLLEWFVPTIEAAAGCGNPYAHHYGSCWQCQPFCGRWAACDAVCRSGCGCQVVKCYC